MKIILSVLCCWLFVNISVLRKKTKSKTKTKQKGKGKKMLSNRAYCLDNKLLVIKNDHLWVGWLDIQEKETKV
jgi:hypothetical protein